MARIIVIDDDADIVRLVAIRLARVGHDHRVGEPAGLQGLLLRGVGHDTDGAGRDL